MMQPGDLFPFALTKTSKQISMGILGNRSSCCIGHMVNPFGHVMVMRVLCCCVVTRGRFMDASSRNPPKVRGPEGKVARLVKSKKLGLVWYWYATTEIFICRVPYSFTDL